MSQPSDLKTRVFSAIVMVAVASVALWFGGRLLDGFIVLIALVTFVELVALVLKATGNVAIRLAGIIAGLVYVATAACFLIRINSLPLLLLIIGLVIAVDVCAYFSGRAIGGPKIAPAISPSKTWAGLGGGVLGALFALVAYFSVGSPKALSTGTILELLPFAVIVALVAQGGDFFESWLKRRAGVKDSSNLIPGHGGFFDRVDGLLPVAIAFGWVLLTIYPHWLDR